MSASPRKPSLFWPLWLMVTLVFASHWEVAPMMPTIEWIAPDKFIHFAVFGLLGTLWIRRFQSHGGVRAVLFAWIMTAGFGLVDECTQAFNPVRFFDPADLLADASGAFVAIAAYQSLPCYRRILEIPLRLRRPSLKPPESTP